MNTKLRSEIKKYNQTAKYKIRYRPKNSGYSLYLALQRDGNRDTQDLKGLYISNSISDLSSDKNILRKAYDKQMYYDQQYNLKGDKSFLLSRMKEMNVIDFYEDLKNTKEGNTKKNWSNALNHFKRFTNGHIKFSDLSIEFCKGYRKYLLNQVSKNTACTYFSNLKAVLNNAVMKELVDRNNAAYVRNSAPNVEKEFLRIEEIAELVKNLDHIGDVQRAFLFCCFTGLRISDIKELKWSNIIGDHLEFRQIKTQNLQRMKLPTISISILNIQRGNNDYSRQVFQLPGFVAMNRHLKKWLLRNNIYRHITFHCARHTFATMCLTKGIEVFIVMKLLGHKDIKHTLVYTKLIDKTRDDAMMKLPSFDIEVNPYE